MEFNEIETFGTEREDAVSIELHKKNQIFIFKPQKYKCWLSINCKIIVNWLSLAGE
ncbi:MAG TPA: hypothetical protein VEC37_12060 [Bacillota bacterium]|nr:hypothetical protein [Bacillota bacterium]